LLLTSNYPRWLGDTTTPFVHNLAVDLGKRGWSITVLAPHAPGASTREQVDGVDVHRFRYALPERAETVCYGGGSLVNVRESKGAALKVPLVVGAEWLATLRQLRTGFDVVHAHWILPQGFVSAALPSRGAVRIITAHGGDVFGLRGNVVDRFARAALTRADAVTVNSKATQREVDALARGQARVRVIPIGTDTDSSPDPALTAKLRQQHRRGAGPFLVFVGRIVEEKGVTDVVSAVAELRRTHPDVTAAIVGAGQHVELVRQLAAELGVADAIDLPGWADQQDVPSWFASADVVLAPSRIGKAGWQEGQGLSIIEAMGAGRPVVATTTGGIPETITDGQTGLLVPPAAPDRLADAVRQLIADPDRAAAIGAQARDSVAQRFSREASADTFADLYAELLERRAPGGR
jgi:glycosyltransferase involved in cell wall biosynthesis